MWGTLSNEAQAALKPNSDDMAIRVKIATPDVTEVSFFLRMKPCGNCKSFSRKNIFLFYVFTGDRYFYINDVNTQVEFKSHQWFGATVRAHGSSVLVRTVN